MLCKIRCNPIHLLHDTLFHRMTRWAFVANRYTYAPPRCSVTGLLIPLSVSLSIDFWDSVFDGVGLACFMSRVSVFLYCIGSLLSSHVGLDKDNWYWSGGLHKLIWGLRTVWVLTESNPIFRNDFVCIQYRLCDISTEIIEGKYIYP